MSSHFITRRCVAAVIRLLSLLVIGFVASTPGGPTMTIEVHGAEVAEDGSGVASTCIWSEFDQLVIVNHDALAEAAEISISVDGDPAAAGDQLVFAFDVEPGEAFDFRQALVLDTNGFMRLRHLDGNELPGDEDPFGTSVKLPPGLILDDDAGGASFFLGVQVEQIDLNTSLAWLGILQLSLWGKPADGPSAGNPNTAPVAVRWKLVLLPPGNDNTVALLHVRADFETEVKLSESHLSNAEAFRAFEFSSSNVDAENTSLGERTHDADQLVVLSQRRKNLVTVDLNTAPVNQLLFAGGLSYNGSIALNQINPAPLNFDPPNIAVSILPGRGSYRAQGFITLNEFIDENSDNVGVWAGRTFGNRRIQAGSRLSWTVAIVASDAPWTR